VDEDEDDGPTDPLAERATQEAEPVDTDSEATVTLAVGRPPAPVPHPDQARKPAYGAFGGAADSELPTQMIAPLPFGAPGNGAVAQPARAFQAQPPAGPPLDLQDERPRGDRRRRGIAALLIVLVLVAVALLGGVLLVKGLRRDGGGSSAGDQGGATASLGPATIPPGYTRYQGGGFTVGVPAGWPAQSQRDGVVDVKERNTTRFLRLITVDSTTSASEQLSAAERQFADDPSYGQYHRVRLQRVDYRGLDAADWEFTFTLDGVPRHVVYRGIVTGGRTYGLYLSTPEDQWAKSRTVFQTAADTFRTS
jgi:hypothetical protein